MDIMDLDNAYADALTRADELRAVDIGNLADLMAASANLAAATSYLNDLLWGRTSA